MASNILSLEDAIIAFKNYSNMAIEENPTKQEFIQNAYLETLTIYYQSDEDYVFLYNKARLQFYFKCMTMYL